MSNLSQAEIDAMLQGQAVQPASEPGIPGDEKQGGYNPMDLLTMSGEELEKLIESLQEDISNFLSPTEVDALGEIGNICMGTSATTMYTLLGRKVTITTPQVSVYKAENVLSPYKSPFLVISVEYVEGIFGKNLLILKDYDAALITDLLMGGDGIIDKDNIELTELHLSAMSEIMNQMVGASATAMSNMMGGTVNISPPQATSVGIDENISNFLDGSDFIVKISFDMEIEGLLKSKLMQLMKVETAKTLVTSLMHISETGEMEEVEEAPPAPAPVPKAAPAPKAASAQSTHSAPVSQKKTVTSVKTPTYESFDENYGSPRAESPSNLDLIHDIPLQVTVELGKTKKNISEILNFGNGSIIVLDKLAGELVDVIVNGKRIARGEVVIIDENYGVRITEIFKQNQA